MNEHDKELRRSQRGFITLMALVILAFILSLANAYFTAGSKEQDVAKIMLAADRARLAAHAAARLVAGTLVQDAVSAPATDHCAENWALTTENTSATLMPYALDSNNGVYFKAIAVDLSGRIKANATAEASSQTLMTGGNGAAGTGTGIPSVTMTNAIDATTGGGTGGYWTYGELYRVTNIANSRTAALSPYGRDFKININTVDYREDCLQSPGFTTTSPAWLISFMLKVTLTNSFSNNFSRKLIRSRRGGSGQDNNVTFEDPDYDSNQQLVWTDVTIPTDWRTLGATFTTQTVNSVNLSRMDAICANYGRVTSEGFFLIKGIGWVVKDPSAGSAGDKRAEYRILRVIKRSSTGYQDCANREGFFQRGDLLVPPFVNGDYDYEQAYYIYNANY